MTVDSSIWSTLVDLNKTADSLIERARKRIEPSPPVSRELLTNASIEVRFNNLEVDYDYPTPVNSDALWGNNVKRNSWTNGASRLYLRELAFQTYYVNDEVVDPDNRNTRRCRPRVFQLNVLPPYYRWNFQTSITQKQYADKRVSMLAGGRQEAGNHLAFRDPLVLEPMETFTFEVELLAYGGSSGYFGTNAFVVALYLSGYREGM